MRRCTFLALAWLLATFATPAHGLERDEEVKGTRITVPGFPTQAAYCFVPEDYDASKTYTLFLAFKIGRSGEEHGFYMSDLMHEGNTIVAAMNMLSSSSWSSSRHRRDKPWLRVANLWKALKQKYNLSPRMFIATESYGARPMQDFAYGNPKRVCGLAIHDPDYLTDIKWNTPRIPTLITVSSNSSWEMRRVERFLDDCKRNNYRTILFQTVPGYTYQYEEKAKELLRGFYRKCTGSKDAGVPEEVVKNYRKAVELAKIDEFGEAIELLKRIAAAEDAGDYPKMARGLLGEIAAAAAKRLEDGDKLSEADKVKAIDIYRDVATKFRGTSAAEKAEAKLRELGVAATPTGKPTVPDKPDKPEPPAESKDEEFARTSLQEARRLLAEGERAKALLCLRTAAMYTGTRAGREAADQLKQLAAADAPKPPETKPDKPDKPDTPAPAASTAERECQQWLALARNYMANKRTSQARTYLNRVIRKHPGTAFADEAKLLLEECSTNR